MLRTCSEDNTHSIIMNKIKPSLEGLPVGARLQGCVNVDSINGPGNTARLKRTVYPSAHLYLIEKFVRDIERGWKGGFIEESARFSGMKIYCEQYLDKQYYALLNDWIRRYSDLHRYAARIEVFYDVVEELNLFDRLGRIPFRFGHPGETDAYHGIRYMDWFATLIDRIRARCQSREFKERERLRLINAKRNEAKVLAMEEQMFSEEGRSRWLILSLTLQYKAKYRSRITPGTMQMHRDKFFASRRSNKLTGGIKNYVCRMEQGSTTGLHLHVILFYSTDSNRDESIAQQIGEYWENVVTESTGQYWSSNAGWRKKGYEIWGHGVGVGQINWNEFKKRDALRKNLMYLAKPEQYLMMSMDGKMRAFTMGEVPKKEKSGRPREKLEE